MAVNVIKRSWKVDRLVRPETLNGMTFQAESGGHRFEITGYDANGSMIAFGGTVTAVFLRPDNTDVALSGVLSNGIAQVTLTEECYQVAGRFGLAIFVNQNNTKTVVYDCLGTVARTSSGVAATSVVEDVSTLIDRIEAAVNSIPQDYSALSKAVGNITCPELRNGSTGNPWNTDSVTTKYIIKLDKTCDDLILEYIGNTSAAQYVFGYSIFKGVADGTESYEARSTAQSYADFPEQYVQTEPYVIIPMSQFGDYTHIAIVLWARSDDTTYIPLRIATDQYNLRVTFRHASYIGHEDINNRSVKVGVQNAAKMASPLKLVHFSDLHKDINALNRIKASAEFVCPNADNIICTGDMVANTYAEITSWWPPEIMTVIGNHDTASWDGSAYDWTALSMAQRDEMYISPFKAYWGITHTAGTSYYYKDYPTANIRLIVLDAMLYSGTPGAEATAQTSWLANLLVSAITDSLHVIIAIHAPHGGSVPVACNFTKLGQDAMPVNVDCNTPDVVINTVATAIGNGLHFIGYICGHTHQDAIWDATGDGTQLMYCITCAAVDQTAQWINSDQYRTDEQDAFNVLTIDTASTTIKILRGGGANTDVALRPRVSLVIDYSTGKIITDTYASGAQDAVVYGEAQTLTDAEKAQARTNIGAGSAADVSENTADITANANEITSLKSAVKEDELVTEQVCSAIGTGFVLATNGTYESGTYYKRNAPNTPISLSSYNALTVDVGTNQIAEITGAIGSGGNAASVCMFLNENYDLLGHVGDGSAASVSLDHERVLIPTGTKYMRLSSVTNVATCAVYFLKNEFDIDEYKNTVNAISNKLDKYTEKIPVQLTKTVGIVKYSTLTTDGSVSRYRNAHFTVSPGEKYSVTCYTYSTSYPGAFVYNSQTEAKQTLINTVGTGVVDGEITIPDGFDTLYLNTVYDTSDYPLSAKKIVVMSSAEFWTDYNGKSEKISLNSFNISNLERRANLLDERNPFAWSTFDHPYFVFVHDDSNSFIADTYTAFHAKNVPFGEATIISKLDNVYSGHTVKEWLDLMVADGGEVLTHWSGDLKDSTSDETWWEKYVVPKIVLGDNGFNVRGTILADSSTPRSNKGQKFSQLYYDYSDKVGKTPQYNIGRTLLGNYADLTEFKAQIDADCLVNGIHAYGFHGTSTETWVTEAVLEEIIDYVVAKGGIITTYGNLYDMFKSSDLEERIKQLES